ncbi:hypothetical protein PHLGIDRAFT_130409 [Phlebiopsis gigantea 11061_1 CR5-6]|uniref:DUF1753-domain-containing protein n=1 Tax=Phlebiopsis gigantea (strain 11061_1 CR5-6) TaxID=745531 RepID=A0A0C3S1A3_PHLG1|nr:hypothetical protein PHLGIDRAFT_130409 [Phlebiopsis gigantea 11061_1 CR5-6]
MKLTLRPEWRLRPLSSFLGCFDLKTGVSVAILFAILNKVAGVYGLISVFTGAGVSAAQLSLYIYSVLGLVAFAWGLRSVGQEDPKHTLYFAHVFFADHVISTAWTVFFAVVWWVYTPHDGRREITSEAQKQIMEAGGGVRNMTETERTQAATALWNQEKGTATAVIILGWLSKIYFALLIYSYAVHLRKGSYRTLPKSRPTASPYAAVSTLPDEEEDVEDFYLLPVRGPPSAPGHGHTPSGSSISSFADFVSAPGRSRRGQKGPRKPSALNPANSRNTDGPDEVDEVLFDEDELAAGLHTKASTDVETASASGSGGRNSPDEEHVLLSGERTPGASARRTSRARQ